MVNYTTNKNDFENLCVADMAANGLDLQQPLIIDGKIKRYSADKKYGKNEWYVVYEYVLSSGQFGFICIYGSWRTGVKHQFYTGSNQESLNLEQKAELKTFIKRKQQDAEQQIKIEYDEAAQKAAQIWHSSADIPASEAYIRYASLKGIAPIGVKFGLLYDKFPAMIIPVRNVQGQIRSLQYIFIDEQGASHKVLLSGGEKKGNFHIIGNIEGQSTLYIVEGYATGVSIYMATNRPVIVAFDAYNIEYVLRNVKTTFKHHACIIAADNDATGKERAFAVAKILGCDVVVPHFPEGRSVNDSGNPYTDFNDLHHICGLDEVRNQLQNVITVESEVDRLKKLALTFLPEQDPCADFDIAALPNELHRYIASLCKSTQAHPIMITSSVLTTVSAFVGRRVVIPKGEYFQELFPNVWILNVAGSGQFKTTALKLGAELAFKQQEKVSVVIKQLDDELKICKDSERQQELLKQRLEESRKDVILPTRVTGEGLIKHLSEGHGGAIFTSELGAWLQNLAKNHNNDLKGILTDLFDVPSSWRNLTKTQGDHTIIKPFISICGVSTLSWLQRTLEEDDVSNGFLARFLIFAPSLSNNIPVGLPRASDYLDEQARERFENVMQNILTKIQDGREYRFSKEARVFFDHEKRDENDYYEGWHQKIHTMTQVCDEKTQEILAPYPRRWSPYLLKLAMLMQLFEDPTSEEIGISALSSAWAFLVPAIKSTIYLFSGPLGGSQHEQACEKVLAWLAKRIAKTGKLVKRHDLISSKQLPDGADGYDRVLKTLIHQGRVVFTPGTNQYDSFYSLANQVIEDD